MSKKTREPCDLCGLDIEDDRFRLRTPSQGEKKFCCEGCLGIWRLVNDDQGQAEPAANAAQ